MLEADVSYNVRSLRDKPRLPAHAGAEEGKLFDLFARTVEQHCKQVMIVVYKFPNGNL